MQRLGILSTTAAALALMTVCPTLTSAFGRSQVVHNSVATGGADTGGADNKALESGAAWFLGERPIRYCIAVAPDFGVDKEVIDRAITKAATAWAHYIADHDVSPLTSNGFVLDTSLMPIEHCDGSEDLAFYMGVHDEHIDAVKATYENPTGFAHRLSYDLQSGWGKGLIWVAPPASVYPGAQFPDWTEPCTLDGILLHEFGHVLGAEDIDGTIMDSYLTSTLQMARTYPDDACRRLSHIDNQRELLLNTHMDYRGSFTSLSNDPNYSRRLFALLAGSDPVGPIHTRLTLAENQGFIYTVSDDAVVKTFSIKILPEVPAEFSGGQIFKAAKGTGQDSGKTGTAVTMASNGKILHGLLTPADGKPRLVLIKRNADGLVHGPVALDLFDNNMFLPIFEPDLRATTTN